MNPNEHHKTVVYVILGIIIVVALGVYIYIALVNAGAPAQEQPTAGNVEQMRLQERTGLAPFTSTSMTAAQRNAERAGLKKY